MESEVHVGPRGPEKEVLVTKRWVTLRVYNVASGLPAWVVKRELEWCLEQDRDLNDVDVKVYFVVQFDDTACATAAFHTSLPANVLAERLQSGIANNPHTRNFQPYEFDSGFGGFTPLYESAGADVDIIAIPGLNGHAVDTWNWPDTNTVWLRDYLPDDMHGIRVLTYGYNTSLEENYSKDTIEELGRRLLEDINAFRGDIYTARRPIVFIAHSLGGLVVKEALVHAYKKRSDPKNLALYKACYGLLFFGVPNLGLRHEGLVSIVAGKPNEALVRDLVVDTDSEPSAFLKRISSDFAECCKGRYKVVSFYERRLSSTLQLRDGQLVETGHKRLLVTEKSATSTGLTAVADESNISIDADHDGLVKYKSKFQGPYGTVRARLTTLVEEARQEVGRRFTEQRDTALEQL